VVTHVVAAVKVAAEQIHPRAERRDVGLRGAFAARPVTEDTSDAVRTVKSCRR
jgi:hypothetical protein